MDETSRSGSNGRKRPRTPPPFLEDQNTASTPAFFSSDPAFSSSDLAFFSSDPPEPSVEQYASPRVKRQYRGTCYDQAPPGSGSAAQPTSCAGKRTFQRNLDSGIFLASDDTVDDSPVDEHESVGSPPPRLAYWRGKVEAAATRLARQRIFDFVSLDHSGMNPSALCLRGIGLEELTNDMIAPLQHLTVVGPNFDYLGFGLDLSENALTSLPTDLFLLENLGALNLMENNLSYLPVSIRNARSLSRFRLDSNRLRYLPGEMLDRVPDMETEPLHWSVGCNTLVQPFPFVGVVKLLKPCFRQADSHEYADECLERYFYEPKLTQSKSIGILRILKHRLAQVQQDVDAPEDQRKLFSLQKAWFTRLLDHYLRVVARVWLASFLRQPEAKEAVARATVQDLLACDHLSTAHSLSERIFERYMEEDMSRSWAFWLEFQTVLIAATPVCYLDFDGRPKDCRHTPPSEIPVDQIVLKARLVAMQDLPFDEGMLVLRKRSSGLETDPLPIRRTDEISYASKPSGAASLFEHALNAAAALPDVHLLPDLLPDDCPMSVQNGVQSAIKSKKEGLKVCYRCGRSFITARAEWIEYHVTPSRKFIPADLSGPSSSELFVPFLRRVCSWACVPEYEFEDEI